MNGHVLMIDDSVALHRVVESKLLDENLQFSTALDAATGLRMAAELRPTVILLDVDLPDLTGFEVCGRLKEMKQTASIPVIFLTADAEMGNKVKGLNLGAADYVTKPFNTEELTARIRTAMRSRRQIEQEAGIDQASGLWNQSFLTEHLKSQLSLSKRTGSPVSCIAVDIDSLRLINSRHGRPAGDDVIRTVGDLLLENCRAEDAVCTCGGGNFFIVMSGLERQAAGRLAERLSKQMAQRPAAIGKTQIPFSCSFGVADTVVATDSPLTDRALSAVAIAKRNGSGTVTVARRSRNRTRSAA